MSRPTRRNPFLLAAVIHGAATFTILALLTDAWPYWKDAGQLMAAYGTGGLPHPTGFPLAASVGRILSLLPLGTFAFRINLLSVGAAALTSTTLFLLAAWLTVPRDRAPSWPSWILAWGAAWAFLAARTVWFHSLGAEVYLPSAALSVALIAIAVRSLVPGDDPHRDRTLRLLALGTGIASGLHITALAAGAGSLAVVALAVRRPGKRGTGRGGLVAQVGLFLLAGLLIQWYLPLRAWSGPWTRFADPSTFSGWLGYATGRTIRSAFQGEIGAGGSLTTFSENAALYGSHMVRQAGPALLLAVVGLLTLARRAPMAGLLIAATWAGDLVFTVVVNPMGQRDYQTGVLSFFVIFLAAAIGVVRLLELLPSRRALRWAAAALAAAGLLAAPAASFPAGNRSLGASGLPYRYGLAILRPLPPGSLILTTLDDASGLLLYHQLLENRRRDCLNLVVQNLATRTMLTAQVARYGALFFPPPLSRSEDGRSETPALRDARDVNAALVGYNLRRGNPVFWQPGQVAFHRVVQGHLQPGFPLGRVRVDPGPSPPAGRWRAHLDAWRAWRSADPAEPDPVGRMVLADVLGLAGALQVQEIQEGLTGRQPPPEGPVETAEALFSESLHLFDEDCRIWSNFAVLKGLVGQIDFAAKAADRAAGLCPLHPASRANQVRYRILSGDMQEGLEAAADAAALPNRDQIVPRLLRLAEDLDRIGMKDAGAALRRVLD